MGCNCKQKNKEQSQPVIVNKADGSVQLKEPPKPEYSKEEIMRVQEFFIRNSHVLTEKKWVINFHNKHFPEQLTINCIDCWIRVKNRMDHLIKRFEQYEQWQKTSGETSNDAQ
jgi:hypothetical protein